MAMACRTWPSPPRRNHPRHSKVPNVGEFIHLYLNSGKRDAGGMPVFVYSDRVPHPKGNWGPVRIVDLDRDGAVDFVVGSLFSETNPKAYLHSQHQSERLADQAGGARCLLTRSHGRIPGRGWRRHPRQRVRHARRALGHAKLLQPRRVAQGSGRQSAAIWAGTVP